MDVVEYDLDANKYIVGWRLFPAEKRPDLINSPALLPALNVPGGLYDAYGKLKYKLINNQIVSAPQIPTASEIQEEKLNRLLLRGLKYLLQAAYDGKTWGQVCTAIKTFIDSN